MSVADKNEVPDVFYAAVEFGDIYNALDAEYRPLASDEGKVWRVRIFDSDMGSFHAYGPTLSDAVRTAIESTKNA